ncbi:hypothetical protein ETD83_16205 [Actinomadura soli]|uniref:Uncharacterized protein n=1 Tax=Actinomadura soli TaxID=2508997 RepID=A0A5C4JBY7_9ACTN|nr:hypothetical protein [Actinomadura soli]TMR00693.1 hypothetical protein ETD83_16205 [Actinomadura soli]
MSADLPHVNSPEIAMNAHLSDSDRQALRLAQDLREEMRAALPQLPTAPSVSPFVDQAGTPSVLLRLDADSARALMALLAERRLERGAAPSGEPPWVDGTHVPPSVPPPVAQGVPAAQGPVVAAVSPFGEPAYAESPFVPQQPGTSVYVGGTGPTPLVPSPVYPRR